MEKRELKCDCNGACDPIISEESTAASSTVKAEKLVIKVVGTGCAKCNKLTANATEAANELGIDFELTKISDVMEIALTGIMHTPGLIINEKVVSTGKVPSVEDIKTSISNLC